jgi:putative FmdB family regulatory protein
MPIYEYECVDCNKRFERLQRLSDPLLTVCPSCGGGVHKAFSVPAIQFKGSGWYVTDYGRSSSKPGSSGRGSRTEVIRGKDSSKKGGSKNG